MRDILDKDSVLLALYRVSLPKITQAEISTFLAVMNGHDPMYEQYISGQITRAKNMLDLTRKK